jgi:hypothetical protein
MLPKVFSVNGKLFGRYPTTTYDYPITLFGNVHDPSLKWLQEFLVRFHRCLARFSRRARDSKLIASGDNFLLSSIQGKDEFTLLEIVLSFIDFHKKNKDILHFKFNRKFSQTATSVSWSKTISKVTPFLNAQGNPVYPLFSSKKREVDHEEDLLVIFFSILTSLNNKFDLGLKINSHYKLITGRKFEQLAATGLSTLRRIKHRYYSDLFVKMYNLCEIYLSYTLGGRLGQTRPEYIATSNFNVIFEDMVDELVSDSFRSINRGGNDIDKLKHNRDGKIIDHLFQHNSLFDNSQIFYIGDSKYYKPEHFAGGTSLYKQFTYAKNIIQFNIDLFNRTGQCFVPEVRYRDSYSEGYSVSPNFLIYGFVDDPENYYDPMLEPKGEPAISYHHKGRLFDRDTLFVQHIRINFLYVLRMYSMINKTGLQEFRKTLRSLFRDIYVQYFNNAARCDYEFFIKRFNDPKGADEMEAFIKSNFMLLNGKVFCPDSKTMILAMHKNNKSLAHLLTDFQKFTLK